MSSVHSRGERNLPPAKEKQVRLRLYAHHPERHRRRCPIYGGTICALAVMKLTSTVTCDHIEQLLEVDGLAHAVGAECFHAVLDLVARADDQYGNVFDLRIA